jgi:hypothetical protein
MMIADFLPLIFFVFKRHLIREYIYIFLFLAFSFFIQVLTFTLVKLGYQTIFFGFIYDLLAPLIITLFSIKLFDKRLILTASYICFTLILCYLFLIRQSLFFLVISHFYLIAIAITNLFSFLKEKEIAKNMLNLHFNYSILIYYAGSLTNFLIFPFLNSNNYSILIFHNIIETISKLIVFVALWRLATIKINTRFFQKNYSHEIHKTDPPKV